MFSNEFSYDDIGRRLSEKVNAGLSLDAAADEITAEWIAWHEDFERQYRSGGDWPEVIE
jgi:hypothetical protein